MHTARFSQFQVHALKPTPPNLTVHAGKPTPHPCEQNDIQV